ncbi:unnamed protein product [Heterobilharzia americana]|nr:unnamed protein product [Heterobilharzia americana]CAH8441155.1 unnamed protein product [Heterobilharzia americana]
MKFILACTITLISVCSVVFGAQSLSECNRKLQDSMRTCFGKYSTRSRKSSSGMDVSQMKQACMKDTRCKKSAKNCLLTELKRSKFAGCAAAKTYINSVSRMY